MSFSPQSQEVIDLLLRGQQIQSGTVAVGPLDKTLLLLLKILSSDYEAISVLKWRRTSEGSTLTDYMDTHTNN